MTDNLRLIVIIMGEKNTLLRGSKTSYRSEFSFLYVTMESRLLQKSEKQAGLVMVIVDGDKYCDGIQKTTIELLKKHTCKPLIVFTSKFSLKLFDLALELGFDEYIAKPFHIKQLRYLLKNKKRR